MKLFWRIFVFIGIAVALFIAVGAGFGLIVGKRILREAHQGPAKLAAERAILHREGIPTTAAELQRPLPPAALNAAPDYTKLTALLQKKPLSTADDAAVADLGIDAPSTPAQEAIVARILERRSDIMTLVYQAARKPQCVFVRDWSQGMNMKLPDYAAMREAVRFLRARSLLLAKKGRFRDAIATEALGFRVADHAGQDPTLISYLVDISCDMVVLSGMDQILQMSGTNAAIADDIRATIANQRPSISLRQALSGEMVMDSGTAMLVRDKGTAAISVRNGEAPDPALLAIWSNARKNGVIDAMMAVTLHDQRLLLEETSLPEAQRRAAYKRLIRTASDLADSSGLLARFDPTTFVSGMMLPSESRAADREFLAHARERALIAGADVLAYRARHGSYPDRLDQSAPNLPPDPFTGKPLLYRREPHGFVVYSAGAAGHFDGGKPGMKRAVDDAYFRYPAV